MFSPFGLDFLLDPDNTYDDFLIGADWWEERGFEKESFLLRTLGRWGRRPDRHGAIFCGPDRRDDEPRDRENYLPPIFWGDEYASSDGTVLYMAMRGPHIESYARWFWDGHEQFVRTIRYAPTHLFADPRGWAFYWHVEDAANHPRRESRAEALRELARMRYSPVTLGGGRPNPRFYWEASIDGNGLNTLPSTFFTDEEKIGSKFTPCRSALMTLSECYHWYLRRYHELHKPALAGSRGVII